MSMIDKDDCQNPVTYIVLWSEALNGWIENSATADTAQVTNTIAKTTSIDFVVRILPIACKEA